MATACIHEPSPVFDGRTKPPFLRRVHIEGYKSIAYCDVSLQPLTILVGRNSSGKSNFLNALAFLRDALAGDGRGGSPPWRAQSRPATLESCHDHLVPHNDRL